MTSSLEGVPLSVLQHIFSYTHDLLYCLISKTTKEAVMANHRLILRAASHIVERILMTHKAPQRYNRRWNKVYFLGASDDTDAKAAEGVRFGPAIERAVSELRANRYG